MLVMHVIFRDISTSRCGCLSTELGCPSPYFTLLRWTMAS